MASDTNTSLAVRISSPTECHVSPKHEPFRNVYRRIWPVDTTSRMTFLKIPQSVDVFVNGRTQCGLYGGESSIANLPPELQCMILSYLPALDRVCLSLTCKSLAATALNSPYLRAVTWTPWLLHPEDEYPSRIELLRRLAHGWTDRSRYRYCIKCHTIKPRDPKYFRDQLPQKKKRLKYDQKVCMDKRAWNKLKTAQQYEHIFKVWSEGHQQDDSLFSCDSCMKDGIIRNNQNPFALDLEKGKQRADKPFLPQLPTTCPACVIHSSRETYIHPRTPVVRPTLWKWTKTLLKWIGNISLVLLYLLYLLFKAPIAVGMWCYKKYKRRHALP